MRLLLDTHVVLWWLDGQEKISSAVRTELASPGHEIWVSVISYWEVGIKTAIGRLNVAGGLDGMVRRTQDDLLATVLPVELGHARRYTSLPMIADHRDPFDRMLIAQAQVEGLTLVTGDEKLKQYGVNVLW